MLVPGFVPRVSTRLRKPPWTIAAVMSKPPPTPTHATVVLVAATTPSPPHAPAPPHRCQGHPRAGTSRPCCKAPLPEPPPLPRPDPLDQAARSDYAPLPAPSGDPREVSCACRTPGGRSKPSLLLLCLRWALALLIRLVRVEDGTL